MHRDSFGLSISSEEDQYYDDILRITFRGYSQTVGNSPQRSSNPMLNPLNTPTVRMIMLITRKVSSRFWNLINNR